MTDRPLWDRLLDPLRSEAAAFRLLVGVVAVCATAILLVVLARAVF